MSRRTVTRTDLYDAVYQRAGLSRTESAQLVESVLEGIAETLVQGEPVKLSSFGTFVVRETGTRVGRNPKTGEEVSIEPRRVVAFKPSRVMKERIARQDPEE